MADTGKIVSLVKAIFGKQIEDVKNEIAGQADTKTTTTTGIDLDITDEEGNVIARLENGGFATKNFDTNKSTQTVPTDADNVDLDISDINGNVILRVQNGYVKTKKFDSTDPFELPSYYPAYLDAKCERIKELMSDCGGDTFFFITDQHIRWNTKQSHKLIKYISEKCRINKLFMGGDMANGVNDEATDNFRKAINGRMYAVCGNHEYMEENGVTDENLTYALTAGTDDEIAGEPLRRYFYVDNPKKKVRYILLNAYKENNSSTSWSQGYEQAQEDWLTDVAMVVETDWTIIVISHAFYDCDDMRYPVLTQLSWTKHILDAIDASSYADNVACIICGHSHLDAIRATDGGIPVLITTCDKYVPASETEEQWLLNRIPGTVTEQAFEVCVLDTVNKKLTAVRIGGFNTGDSEDDEELFEIGERVIEYGSEGE